MTPIRLGHIVFKTFCVVLLIFDDGAIAIKA